MRQLGMKNEEAGWRTCQDASAFHYEENSIGKQSGIRIAGVESVQCDIDP
jgi:hypothetical protein